jgi:hypothetical protein
MTDDDCYYTDELVGKAVYSLTDPPVFLGTVLQVSADEEYVLVRRGRAWASDESFTRIEYVRFGE